MSNSSNDWPVLIPLSDLAALQSLGPKVDALQAQVKALDRRVEGLHRTAYELMDELSALRAKLAECQQAPGVSRGDC